MKSTQDYSIFKKHELNRCLNLGNLRKIENSVRQKNILNRRPILVDENFHVIDGQHRLEAAKKLNVPIFYEVQTNDQSTYQDVLLLNANQKSWTAEDYLNYYVKRGFEEYVLLNNFLIENKLNLYVCKNLFNQSGGNASEYFRMGRYKFPEKIDEYKEKLNNVNAIKGLIRSKTVGDCSYIDTPTFMRAISRFISIKECDFVVFFKKIEMKLECMKRCTKYGAYFQLFMKIYNYKNPNPLKYELAD